jgi:type IV pilus assembly protein PilZ
MSEPAQTPEAGRPSVLSLNIKERSALYAAYIAQLKDGGLFIPTNRVTRLGDEVFMLISLPDDPVKLPVAGKVVWITPAGAQGNKAQGIGVQFSADESGQSAKRKIESVLGAALNSTKTTHTI